MNEWDTPCVDNGGDWCLIALLQVSCQLVEDAERVMRYSSRRGEVIVAKRFFHRMGITKSTGFSDSLFVFLGVEAGDLGGLERSDDVGSGQERRSPEDTQKRR